MDSLATLISNAFVYVFCHMALTYEFCRPLLRNSPQISRSTSLHFIMEQSHEQTSVVVHVNAGSLINVSPVHIKKSAESNSALQIKF